ncbi:c-type cytochrome [Chitinophaga sp. NPDC101104]|uniref:c-type cytochrome n=1 Tax=Chitinophaga sp. NPDC101104 TaxID=3390561 RepID=UPI003D072FA4
MKPAIILLTIIFISCTARRMPLAGNGVQGKEAALAGKKAYQQYCDKCHPGGEAGLGPALNNNPAPGFLKRFQVRHGLGAMPAFDASVVSPEDLDHIMAYLKAKRREPALPR